MFPCIADSKCNNWSAYIERIMTYSFIYKERMRMRISQSLKRGITGKNGRSISGGKK